MVSLKIIISSFAVLLTFVGYVPYILDIIKKKTTPHSFTWFIFSIAGGTACSLQIVGGAGIGSWALIGAVTVCLIIFVMSLRIGNKDITRSDVVFLLLALTALFLWVVVKQPVWSAILATGVEILGFVPTVRKSWNKPYSETLWTYEVAFFRHGISLFALQQFNILTTLYPIAWTLSNFFFILILSMRRKAVKKLTI